jgi:hypothetical protein
MQCQALLPFSIIRTTFEILRISVEKYSEIHLKRHESKTMYIPDILYQACGVIMSNRYCVSPQNTKVSNGLCNFKVLHGCVRCLQSSSILKYVRGNWLYSEDAMQWEKS